MRALVIGTSGQLAVELFRRGPVHRLELLPAAKVDVTAEAELEAHLNAQQPNIILNASGYTAVDAAERDRDRAYAINAAGPQRLARWCHNHGASLIHVSTDYVFDGNKQGAYAPDDPTAPLNVYGASKLEGEAAITQILERHVILRTSWVFSAHGHNFVKTMLRLARERDELRVVADQRGRPTAASDLADAVLTTAITLQQRAVYGTFHFANQGEATWHELAQAVVDQQAELTGRRPQVVPIATSEYPTPARRPMSSVLDTLTFERTFEMRPRPWRSALRDVVQELVRP